MIEGWGRRVAVLGFVGAAWVVCGAVHAMAGTLASHGAAQAVDRVMTALEQNDFRTLFDLAWKYQAAAEQLRSQYPKSMWQKVTDEVYQKCLSEFTRPAGAFDRYYQAFGFSTKGPYSEDLVKLLRPRPRWVVEEVRPEQRPIEPMGPPVSGSVAFVRLSYTTVESSPVAGKDFVKELVLEVFVEGSRDLFVTADPVPGSVTFWKNAPVRIVAATWNTSLVRRGAVLQVHTAGGAAPVSGTADCGWSFDWGLPQQAAADTGKIEFVKGGVPPPDTAFPLKCSVAVVDGAGTHDRVIFSVSRFNTGGDADCLCAVRKPWADWESAPDECCRGDLGLLDGVSGEVEGGWTAECDAMVGTKPTNPNGLAILKAEIDKAKEQLDSQKFSAYVQELTTGFNSYEANRIPDAVHALRLAVEDRPGDWMPRQRLTLALAASDQPDESLRNACVALRRFPDRALYLAVAQSFYEKRDKTKALRWLDVTLGAWPELTESTLDGIFKNLVHDEDYQSILRKHSIQRSTP